MSSIVLNVVRGARLALVALGLAIAYLAVLAAAGALPAAEAHMTCQVDDNGIYTQGLNHIHGNTAWQVNTAKSRYSGGAAYLAWQSFGPASVPVDEGVIFCPNY